MTRFIDTEKYRGFFKKDPLEEAINKSISGLEVIIKQVEAQNKDNWTSVQDDDLNTLKRAYKILQTRQK